MESEMEKHQDQFFFKTFIWFWVLLYSVGIVCAARFFYVIVTASASGDSLARGGFILLIAPIFVSLSMPVAIWKMVSVYRRKEWEKIRWSFAIPIFAILLVLASFEIVPRIFSWLS